jgi:hypothetical protein
MDQELKTPVVENETVLEETVELNVETDSDTPVEMESEREETLEEKMTRLRLERTGTFKINMTYSDATYLRNRLDKSEWVGPQQAYLLIISKLELSSICEELAQLDKKSSHQVELTAATIESTSYFLNKATGVGEDSAQKLFAASMLLRPALSEMGRLDEELKSMISPE